MHDGSDVRGSQSRRALDVRLFPELPSSERRLAARTSGRASPREGARGTAFRGAPARRARSGGRQPSRLARTRDVEDGLARASTSPARPQVERRLRGLEGECPPALRGRAESPEGRPEAHGALVRVALRAGDSSALIVAVIGNATGARPSSRGASPWPQRASASIPFGQPFGLCVLARAPGSSVDTGNGEAGRPSTHDGVRGGGRPSRGRVVRLRIAPATSVSSRAKPSHGPQPSDGAGPPACIAS